MTIAPFFLENRMKFMRLTSKDCAAIRRIKPMINHYIPLALDALYDQVRATDETRKFFPSESIIAHAKEAQSAHWRLIADGCFDQAYAAQVRKIGEIHARIGLEPRWYIGGYSIVLSYLQEHIMLEVMKKRPAFKRDHEIVNQLAESLSALTKAVMLEIDMTISVYRQASDEVAEAKREEALSTAQKAVVDGFGRVMGSLASGDLTARIDENTLPDVYKHMGADLNKAMVALGSALHGVKVSVSSINTTANEISAATLDLAKRTEAQASSVERTAAAVEEITATVQSTSERVGDANKFVGECRAASDRLTQRMSEATLAMTEIDKSAKAIAEITTIMQSISVQTNLLALNTGVEAARAGEAGSGFRILAQEIRSLASRASDASKSVKDLILVSTKHVTAGVEIMNRAGIDAQDMASGVSTISEHLGAIAVAAEEQATALGETNAAIALIDQGTRQNAAMVEETSAASTSLTQEANALKSSVGVFNTEGKEEFYS